MYALYIRRTLRDVRGRDLLGGNRPRRLWPDREGAESPDRRARGESDPRFALRYRLRRWSTTNRSRRPNARGRSGSAAGGFLEVEGIAGGTNQARVFPLISGVW